MVLLQMMVRESLLDGVTLGWGPRGGKGVSHVDIHKKSIQVTRKRKFRDPKLYTEAKAQILGGIPMPSTSSPTVSLVCPVFKIYLVFSSSP